MVKLKLNIVIKKETLVLLRVSFFEKNFKNFKFNVRKHLLITILYIEE